MDTRAREYLGLPKQRAVIGVFGDAHIGQKRFRGQPTFDQMLERWIPWGLLNAYGQGTGRKEQSRTNGRNPNYPFAAACFNNRDADRLDVIYVITRPQTSLLPARSLLYRESV